ncbi:ABC-type multidrug transport system permease subunit [Kibdelosporangium banguiense]|uniref:ABC-type multidrug transport system permease subunit n=1 Tax=Kibdelosporangium banguiense TaxID=1365924 RepID=A0ABS4TUP8_9PSEU|nr:ABC-type multidrug transport system permease subunit [Kibdelosporangium banguiense]
MSSDSAIMLRRNFKHTLRNPVAVFNAILMPVIMMLMFVYVFGDAFNVGGGDYINYATPGMIMMALSYGLSATAVAVSSDMTKGIINRFKVMDVSRDAVLTGHVVSTVVRTMLAVAAIIGMAFLFGFSPTGSFPHWLAAVGLLLLVVVSVSRLTVAFGLAAKTVDIRAGNPLGRPGVRGQPVPHLPAG